MDHICYVKIINSIGLIFDIIGVVLLFFPDYKKIEENIFEKHLGGESNEAINAEKNRRKRGIAFIVIGFILQLISNWL